MALLGILNGLFFQFVCITFSIIPANVQAWIETGVAGYLEDSMWGSKTRRSSSFSCKAGSLSDTFGQEDLFESPYLYIQMEYCPRLTLISDSSIP